MLCWMTAVLDSVGGFACRHERWLVFALPGAGIVLVLLIGQLGGHTGVRIFSYIAFPVVAFLVLSVFWHQARTAESRKDESVNASRIPRAEDEQRKNEME